MTVKSYNHTLAAKTGTMPSLVIERWGYEASGPDIATVGPSSPGPTLVATSGQPVNVTWVNGLKWHIAANGERIPPHHPFCMAEAPLAAMMMEPRYFTGHIVAHLHGGHVPWTSDGYPVRLPTTDTADYANPTGHVALRGPGGTIDMVYPNHQPAATLWYHDHTMDSTATNVYAGLAGGYVLSDPGEATAKSPVLRTPGVPLVIQDISLVADPHDGRIMPYHGQIATLQGYLDQRDNTPGASRATLSAWLAANPPAPEFKGNAMMVNTALWPTYAVPQGPVRFRLVNGCAGRVLVMRLSKVDPATQGLDPWQEAGSTDLSISANAMTFWQIGSDGGFLSKPEPLDGIPASGSSPLSPDSPEDTQNFLILSPGERADIVIDFSSADLQPGDHVFLTNHAIGSAPFGNGGDEADAAPGLDQIIRFDVTANAGLGALDQTALQADLTQLNTVPVRPAPAAPGSAGYSPDRALVIAEFGDYATNPEIAAIPHPSRPPWTGIGFLDRNTPGMADTDPGYIWAKKLLPAPAVLTPGAGGPLVTSADHQTLQKGTSGEWKIWEIWNISVDIHPMHLHHAQFLVLDRWTIDSNLNLTDSGRPPDPNEQGWKDTVRSAQGEMVRLAVRFDDGGDAANDYTGNYVMHCHLIDHEDMGMMRPLRID
jgi:FtsP/CotA-like multicopper oxidase with cupredoxin domain